MQSNALFCFKAGPRSVPLVPFLYQTRTLAPLFHQRRASHQPVEVESQPTTESQAPSVKISRIDPIYGQSPKDYAEEVASYPSPTEWRQTHSNFRPRSLGTFDELPRSNIDQYEPAPESAEEADDSLNDFQDSGAPEEYDMDSYRPGAKPKDSTITESEKEAFNRIFSDIFNKLKAKDEKIDPFMDLHGRQTTEMIMDLAAKNAAAKRRRQPVSFRSFDATGDPMDVEKRMTAEVAKYPPSLRPAASRALASVARRDVLDSANSSSSSQEQLGEVNRLEHLREPERKRVEQLMRAAKTDFELWQVMEDEVFSIISKLKLKYKEGQKLEQTSTTKSEKADEKSQEDTVPMDDEHSKPSQAEVLGPLYPSHLLLGLRFLSTAFSPPSPLALSILPHIKSLGVVSQVLGASTALYNETLRIQWLRYHNYNAILDLLSEMENSALDFDKGTLEIVQGIQRMRDRVNEGERGEVVREVVKARFEPLRRAFVGWERKIRSEVVERGREFERRLAWAQQSQSQSQSQSGF